MLQSWYTMACGEPPEGRVDPALADQLVECERDPETVRQALKKKRLKPWLKQSWCIPPGQSAEFVCRWKTYWRSTSDGNEVLVCG